MNKNKNLSKKTISFLLDSFHISIDEKKEELLTQIFNFLIVGGISTIIDFTFLIIFKEFFCFDILLSNTLAFSISVIYNYWASLKFVFNVDKSKSKKRNFIIFIFFSIIGLLINDFIVYVSNSVFDIYYILSKIFATFIVMIFNFITRKKFLE